MYTCTVVHMPDLYVRLHVKTCSLLQVLGVSEDASEEEVNKAYRSLVKQWHPDRVSDPVKKEEATAKFMEIQKAHEVLSRIKTRRTSRRSRGR